MNEQVHMIATPITTLRRDSHHKFVAECEARHELRHHVAIAALSAQQASNPAKNPAILAGYRKGVLRA